MVERDFTLHGIQESAGLIRYSEQRATVLRQQLASLTMFSSVSRTLYGSLLLMKQSKNINTKKLLI